MMPGGISIRKERRTVSSRNYLTDKDRFCILKIRIYRKNPGISRLVFFFGGFNDSYGIHNIFDDTSRFLGKGGFWRLVFSHKKQRAVVFFQQNDEERDRNFHLHSPKKSNK